MYSRLSRLNRLFSCKPCRDINFDAIYSEIEAHPNARTLKQSHEDMAQMVVDIRKTVPEADNDPAFKQAADAIEKIVKVGVTLESLPVLDSAKAEQKRKQEAKKLGEGALPMVKVKHLNCSQRSL